MTVQQSGTGASSDHAAHWHGIEWARCYREIRRLQTRIVKATQDGKHGKVSPAMVADPLVQRQGTRRQTGD